MAAPAAAANKPLATAPYKTRPSLRLRRRPGEADANALVFGWHSCSVLFKVSCPTDAKRVIFKGLSRGASRSRRLSECSLTATRVEKRQQSTAEGKCNRLPHALRGITAGGTWIVRHRKQELYHAMVMVAVKGKIGLVGGCTVVATLG